jgi:hypothetical protein
MKTPLRVPVLLAEISVALSDKIPRRYKNTIFSSPEEIMRKVEKETIMKVEKKQMTGHGTCKLKTSQQFSGGMKYLRKDFQDIRLRHSIRRLSDPSVSRSRGFNSSSREI